MASLANNKQTYVARNNTARQSSYGIRASDMEGKITTTPEPLYLYFSAATPKDMVIRLLNDPNSDPKLVYYAFQAEKHRHGILPTQSKPGHPPVDPETRGRLYKEWWANQHHGLMPDLGNLSLSTLSLSDPESPK